MISVTHSTVATLPDEAGAEINKDEWNDEHVVTGAVPDTRTINGHALNANVTVTASDVGAVSTTGSPSSGNIAKFSGAATITSGDLSGDVVTSGTLATTISNDAITTAKIINGAVTEGKITLADVTTLDVSTSKHGLVPKAPNDATKFLDGTGAWDTVKDADLSFSDITTNDVSTSKHGFVPKAPNDANKFLDGTGNWSTFTSASLPASLKVLQAERFI